MPTGSGELLDTSGASVPLILNCWRKASSRKLTSLEGTSPAVLNSHHLEYLGLLNANCFLTKLWRVVQHSFNGTTRNRTRSWRSATGKFNSAGRIKLISKNSAPGSPPLLSCPGGCPHRCDCSGYRSSGIYQRLKPQSLDSRPLWYQPLNPQRAETPSSVQAHSHRRA